METTFLLCSVKYGFLLSLLYDALRALRILIPHKRLWVSVEDLGFWIYTALQVFWMMQETYNGSIRWFSIIGGLSGVLLYYKLASPYLLHLVGILKQKVQKGRKRIKSRAEALGITRRMKKQLTHLKKVLKMNL